MLREFGKNCVRFELAMLGFLSVTSGWVGAAFSCCVVSPTSKLELWFDLLVLPFLSSLKECGSEKELIVPCSFVCFDLFFPLE